MYQKNPKKHTNEVVHGNEDKEENFKCGNCDENYSSIKSLKRHLRDVHGVKGQGGDLQQPSIEPFRCDFCEKSYSRTDSLKRHMRKHHANDKSPNNEIFVKREKLSLSEENSFIEEEEELLQEDVAEQQQQQQETEDDNEEQVNNSTE